MPSEFDLIARYFTRPAHHTRLAVGDDGALITPEPENELVISTDMLVEGTHFFPDADPAALGWKTLAVNVSDMAAMGATPRWALLALALPRADEHWLAEFSGGFFACCEAFGVDLIGGDTTRGPLNLSVTILGEVPRGRALLRSGAHAGDDLWVSGTPGRAALGLAHLQGRTHLTNAAPCLEALYRPQPRVALGLALRGLASAALDVSDGLLGDLAHILERSRLAARINETALPLADLLRFTDDARLAKSCLLSGGDDYELLFCAPPQHRDAIARLAGPLPLHRIGTLIEGSPDTLILTDAQGRDQPLDPRGFDHFADTDCP